MQNTHVQKLQRDTQEHTCTTSQERSEVIQSVTHTCTDTLTYQHTPKVRYFLWAKESYKKYTDSTLEVLSYERKTSQLISSVSVQNHIHTHTHPSTKCPGNCTSPQGPPPLSIYDNSVQHFTSDSTHIYESATSTLHPRCKCCFRIIIAGKLLLKLS